MQSIKANRASRGFTLMEIMLVLVLLGCMAKLALGTLSSSGEINQESNRLAVALQWAAHQAELDGKVYGLSVSNDKWQLMTLNNQPHNKGESYLWPHHYWHPINDGKLKQQRQLPNGLLLELTLQDQPIPLSGMQDDGLINEPKVVFYPGGESSLFELTLSGDGQTRRITDRGVLPDTEASRPMTEPQGN
ncbi:general secretion pathway protein H [Yersinia enterocolitica]|uniref:Type II secretion system protein H n=1 Tax=Yersinia enterocolitica (type O:8) TaxID=34054 RepID=Q8GBE2_YEREN|nr:type II secretion system minor pseudopilin GspH [Yersinia enterocolitica]CAC83033.1 Yts1H protein [Yersinia enterocolitica (type O:8)]AJI83196.1 type II secretion system protein H [Yersinia enterocolitica]EKA26514.1 general secretion pathway protein H [Yersinia enterocolitica subsp. enterocolitica WA-314]ELI8285013.1 type II secretion system minor pseudopilin GspH [Yersinia enterocolitica]KGA69522.1 type II secretion system protein H [Yersinia enterocolitica]